MMPIVFACPCGRQIRAKDGSAGRVFACPTCGKVLEVPPADAVELGIKTNVDQPDLAVPKRSQRGNPSLQITPSIHPRQPASRVVVVDFDMPFSSLVWLIVKFQCASIVALLLIGLVLGGLGAIVVAILQVINLT